MRRSKRSTCAVRWPLRRVRLGADHVVSVDCSMSPPAMLRGIYDYFDKVLNMRAQAHRDALPGAQDRVRIGPDWEHVILGPSSLALRERP